jgi:putative oligomerization/nucleic acid binding protein
MPLVGRRRPLMRAAMVGGAGYAAGKRRARTEQHEYDQDAAIGQQAPPPAAAPPQAAAPAPAPAAMSEADRIQALKNLKELLDTGVLTQAEFDAQKQKLLNG